MAVRVKSVTQPQVFTDGAKYQCQLFADAKEDVTEGMEVIGMPDGEMTPGSSVVTAKGEVAFLKTDGSWSWV